MELKLLIMESDEGRIDLIKIYLNKEFYSVDFAINCQDGLQKMKNENNKYDIIILSIGSTNEKDVNQFFVSLRTFHTDRYSMPFIISKANEDEAEEVKNNLSGKRYLFINKYSKDYISELEWAILNLKPVVFSKYKEKIELSDATLTRMESILDTLKNKINRCLEVTAINDKKVNAFDKEIERTEKKYVKWPDIIETLGILIGAFSLTMGIIFFVIILFFQENIKGKDFDICFIHLIMVFVVVVLMTSYLSYLFFRKRADRIIENKVNKIIERSKKEFLFREIKKDDDRPI